MQIQDKMRAMHTQRWSIVNTTRTQTVAEHSWAVAVITEEICDRLQFSDDFKARALRHATYHDVAEAVIGDIPTPTKRLLRDEITTLENHVHPPVTNDKLIGKIVKMADRVEAISFITMNGVGRHAEKIRSRLVQELNDCVAKEGIGLRTAVTGILEDLLEGDIAL